ncbi:MAG: MBOAT family protein [Bacteroidetes bacterium]|nr:MBOAT family protein [Bacteroidota bacterium]
MLFNSLQFLVYFIFVTTCYFVIPHRNRWILLLSASCFFYMAFIPEYIFILAFTIVIDYFAGIFIEKSQGRQRKRFLVLSLVANIGVLAIFKYYNFFIGQINSLFQDSNQTVLLPALSILLPIGLSFHTFQAMSYTIEVYRRHQKAERHFGIYALYVMFYPQLVAGPIERPQNLLHQFYEKHHFDFERFKSGISLIIFGLFKKVVIADRLSMAVDVAYGDPAQQSGTSLLIATFFYAFQIYCDFSGYADIAIGSARIMGFKLMENFRNPYFSASIAEFWRRWHISLSTWFKDYLYFSLGGNKVSMGKHLRNLLIVFAISGIWHGANYTFLAWGILHGLFLCMAVIKNKLINRMGIKHSTSSFLQPISILITFTLVCLSWVLFRAKSIEDAGIIYSKLHSISTTDVITLGLHSNEIYFSLLLIFLLAIKDNYLPSPSMRNNYAFFISNFILLLLCYFFGVFNLQQFIYFQF